MPMQRTVTRLTSRKEHEDDRFVPGTPAERLLMVWPLTREVVSLSPLHDVERRLQRHVVRLVRGRG